MPIPDLIGRVANVARQMPPSPRSDARPAAPHARNAGRYTEIRPATGLFRGLDLHEVWESREIAMTLASRQLRVRYKQTALGVAWVVLQPAATVVVFTIIFGRLAGLPTDGGIPYPVFVVAGVVFWNYIFNSVQAATQRFVQDRELVTKIYFPRILAPFASVLPPLMDLSVGIVISAVLMAAYGVAPSVALVLLPFWILAAVLVAFAAGMIFAALNVQYRDIGNVLGFLLQLWMFTSPIVFASSSVRGTARTVLSINPVTGLVDGMRFSLLGASAPPAVDLVSLATGLALCGCALWYFQRVERRFADVI